MRPLTLAAQAAELGLQHRRAADFVGLIRALAGSTLRGVPPATLAERAGDHNVAQILKAAAPSANLTDLPDVAAMASAFVGTMRGSSALDAVLAGGAIRVPWQSRVGLLTFAGGGVPGQGKAKPVGRVQVLPDDMEESKAVALAVLSEQLLTAADYPASSVQAELAGALANAQDVPFVAHLTSGIVATPSTGDIETDVYTALGSITRGSASRLVWLGGPSVHDQWSAMPADATPRALGNLTRCDAVTTDSLLLVDAGQVAISDGGVMPDTARHASIELDDDPAGAADSPPAAAQLVSLWQTNSVAVRLERALRYRRLRSTAVISGVNWLATGSPA